MEIVVSDQIRTTTSRRHFNYRLGHKGKVMTDNPPTNETEQDAKEALVKASRSNLTNNAAPLSCLAVVQLVTDSNRSRSSSSFSLLPDFSRTLWICKPVSKVRMCINFEISSRLSGKKLNMQRVVSAPRSIGASRSSQCGNQAISFE